MDKNGLPETPNEFLEFYKERYGVETRKLYEDYIVENKYRLQQGIVGIDMRLLLLGEFNNFSEKLEEHFKEWITKRSVNLERACRKLNDDKSVLRVRFPSQKHAEESAFVIKDNLYQLIEDYDGGDTHFIEDDEGRKFWQEVYECFNRDATLPANVSRHD